MAGIFKAYDVRGLYPEQINEDVAHNIGLSFRNVLDEGDQPPGSEVVVSRDMRSHSIPLSEALIDGLRSSGLDVCFIGLATTPMNYFAIGDLEAELGAEVDEVAFGSVDAETLGGFGDAGDADQANFNVVKTINIKSQTQFDKRRWLLEEFFKVGKSSILIISFDFLTDPIAVITSSF